MFSPIIEFVYKNIKNSSTGHRVFKFNYIYQIYVFYEKDINLQLKLKLAKKLLDQIFKYITTFCKNLYHAQKLQKRSYNKYVKPTSFTLREKV